MKWVNLQYDIIPLDNATYFRNVIGAPANIVVTFGAVTNTYTLEDANEAQLYFQALAKIMTLPDGYYVAQDHLPTFAITDVFLTANQGASVDVDGVGFDDSCVVWVRTGGVSQVAATTFDSNAKLTFTVPTRPNNYHNGDLIIVRGNDNARCIMPFGFTYAD